MDELEYEIKVRGVQFSSCTSMKITQSVDQIVDAAEFVLPLDLFSQFISEGDAVSLEVGYRGQSAKISFSGLVTAKRFYIGIPNGLLEVRCESHATTLRQPVASSNFFDATLRQVIQHIVEPVGLRLSDNIPYILLSHYLVPDITCLAALEKIKSDMGLYIFLDADLEISTRSRAWRPSDSSIVYDDNHILTYMQNLINNKYEGYKLIVNSSDCQQAIAYSDYHGRYLYVDFRYDIAACNTNRVLVEIANGKYQAIQQQSHTMDLTTTLNFAVRPNMLVRVISDLYKMQEDYFIREVTTELPSDSSPSQVLKLCK